MESTIAIFPANIGHKSDLVKMNIAMALETESIELDNEAVRLGVSHALRDPGRGTYYIAQLADTVVGCLLITREWSDWRNAWFWWIQSVYVHPDHRRKGVFRALYEHVVDRARRDATACGIRLYVAQSNKRAQQTYCKLGMGKARYELFELDWSLERAESEEQDSKDCS